MKRVLIGIFIGLGLILMCAVFMWELYDKAQIMEHKGIKRRYVRVKASGYNKN